MNFGQLIKQHKLLDIISIEDTHYALSSSPVTVVGCITILASQLTSYEREFLLRGYSHRHSMPYSKALGLELCIIFSYTLTELPATKKQVFSHALAGTGGRKGLLMSWRGQKLGRSAFIVPQEHEAAATAFLNSWQVQYKAEVVLRG